MPIFHRRSRVLALALALLVVTAIACSSNSESPGPGVGDFETCTGFIDAPFIENITGESGLIDRQRVLDIGSVEGLAESGAVNNCIIEVFRTVDGDDNPVPGDSVSLSVVQFESSELALSLYNSTLAAVLVTTEQVGDLAELEQEVIGADSYLMDVKVGGIGAIVVYVSDSVFVSISSTADAEGNALLDGRSLVTAAQGVQSRLP